MGSSAWIWGSSCRVSRAAQTAAASHFTHQHLRSYQCWSFQYATSTSHLDSARIPFWQTLVHVRAHAHVRSRLYVRARMHARTHAQVFSLFGENNVWELEPIAAPFGGKCDTHVHEPTFIWGLSPDVRCVLHAACCVLCAACGVRRAACGVRRAACCVLRAACYICSTCTSLQDLFGHFVSDSLLTLFSTAPQCAMLATWTCVSVEWCSDDAKVLAREGVP